MTKLFARMAAAAGFLTGRRRMEAAAADAGDDQVRTVALTVEGIGVLTLSGRLAGDPFIFGDIVKGEVFEPHVLDTIAALIDPGCVFVDVGANIGLFAVCAARLAGPVGTIIAIEPDAFNLAMLRRNLKQNAASARIIAGAAADYDGRGALSRSAENAGDHRLASSSRPVDHQVDVVRLDTVLARLEAPAGRAIICKIDAQGSETAILRGLSGVLAAGHLVRVIAEYWPHGLVDCGSSADAMLDELERGFQRFWILWRKRPPEPATIERLRLMGRTNLAPQTEMFVDIVALRDSDATAIAAMEALVGGTAAGPWRRFSRLRPPPLGKTLPDERPQINAIRRMRGRARPR